MRREGIPGPISKTVNANGSGMSGVMERQCLFFQNESNLNLLILTIIFLHILVLLIYIQSPNLLKKNLVMKSADYGLCIFTKQTYIDF